MKCSSSTKPSQQLVQEVTAERRLPYRASNFECGGLWCASHAARPGRPRAYLAGLRLFDTTTFGDGLARWLDNLALHSRAGSVHERSGASIAAIPRTSTLARPRPPCRAGVPPLALGSRSLDRWPCVLSRESGVTDLRATLLLQLSARHRASTFTAFSLDTFQTGLSVPHELLSEQISYIGYPAIINAKFTPEIKRLSIIAAARISNIADLVYSITGLNPWA